MPFTISPSAYRGGEMWFDALTSIGQNLGTNIGKAMQFYEQRHQALSQSDALMEQLSRTPSPGDPKRPVLDKQAYERYMAHSAGERAAIGEGYKTALLFGNELTKSQASIEHLKAEAAHARRLAETSPMAGQYIYHPQTGEPIGQYDEKGAPHYFPKQAMPAAGTEGETPPSQDPSLVIQKPTPAWHKTVNDILQTIWPKGYTGPFKVQPEIRKAAPTQQSGQIRTGPATGQAPDIRSDPRVARIKAAYRAGQMSKDQALRQLQALGYTDQAM